MFSSFPVVRAPLAAAHIQLFPLLFFVGLAWASVNRTIDDHFGDQATGVYPTFSDGWNVCESGCTGIRDPAGAFDQTYVFSDNANVDVTLRFSGTAIYCYGVIPEFGPDASLGLTIRATLDNEPLSVTTVPWPARLSYEEPSQAYSILLYSKTGLENAEHTLVLGGGDGFYQWISFDYAIYTFDGFVPPPPIVVSPKKKSLVGPIVGGVVGGVVFLSALGLLIHCVRRRPQTKRVFSGGIDGPAEKQEPAKTPWSPYPAQHSPRTGLTTALVHDEWTPETSTITTLPSGETQLSLSRVLHPDVMSIDKKNTLRRARREEAAQRIEILQEEIRELTEEAEARVLLPSASKSPQLPPIDPDTNAELTAMRTEMRMLKEQMNILQRQQQSIPELPQYTADSRSEHGHP
ncbi:hypothetical protein B0H19DRAFT_1264248 [Mycena capillaripes]|nr:hypothetical protein B0H19DRAFT_1264248 [Mycena capillaripes]